MGVVGAVNHVVTLEEVLANREERVKRQRAMLAGVGFSVLSFTVNMPGAVKDTDSTRVIFHAGLTAFAKAAGEKGWAIVEQQVMYFPTGPEALARLAVDAHNLKAVTVNIESAHPLGRLFDMDVLNATGLSVSRSELGVSPRTCLLCGKPSGECGRSRAHGVEELVTFVDAMTSAYSTSPTEQKEE